MKKRILSLTIFSIFLIATTVFAVEINTERSMEMINNAYYALSHKDIDSTKMFLRRAIQLNPYSSDTWDTYDEVMKIISKNKPIDWNKLKVNTDKTEEDDLFDSFN